MDWFEILEICRSLDKGGKGFTAQDLQNEVKFPDTWDGENGSEPLQKASSWCAKLAKMKLLEAVGVDESVTTRGRKPNIYVVTKEGLKLKTKPMSRLDRLLLAIAHLKAAHGRPEEGKLYQGLFTLAWQIEQERSKDKKKGKDD